MSASEPFVHLGGPTQEALFAFVAGRLHPEAAGWIGSHVAGCARCQDAMARIESVHTALEPPPEPPFRRQADLVAVRRRLERAPLPLKQIAWGMLAGVTAGIVLVLALHRDHRAPATLAHDGGNVPCTIVARAGAADVELGDDHQVAQAKLALAPGGALTVGAESRVLTRWGGARVAVEGGAAGARVRLAASRPLSRELRLERGRVVLDVDPLQVGAELVVVTPDARVSVHGTRFFVEAGAAGTTVAVDRGRVRVQLASRTIDVAAGQRLGAGTLATVPLQPADSARLNALEPTIVDGPSESLEVQADAPGALVDVDGVARGRAPLSIALPPGIHAVRVRAPGRLPVEERVTLVAGTPSLVRAELPEPAAPASADGEPAAEPAAPKSTAPDARDIMTRARAELLAGEYGRAIVRLAELRQRRLPPVQAARAALLEAQAQRLAKRPERALPLLEPAARGSGPEAEQAQFMLAQTLQRDLNDPLRAAAAFGESQRRFPRGIFAEEAAFRRGEALESYLRAFPSSAHADDAHLHVAEARRDQLDDCGGALPHLRAVADGRGPRAGLALIGEARCLRKLGRGDEARAVYTRYLGSQPHGRYADEARAGASGSAIIDQ